MLQLPGNSSLLIADPLGLVLIPVVFFLLLFPSRAPAKTFGFPSIRAFSKYRPSFRLRARSSLLKLLILVFAVSGGVAVSRPQVIPSGLQENVTANILLVLDLSKSMSTKDIEAAGSRIARIDAVKAVVRQFIQDRLSDRIGLVVFGTEAYLRVPLTLDHHTLLAAVDDLQVGIAGERTAIGDAIAQGVRRVQALPARGRSLILVTDGLNTSGRIAPLKAAGYAQSASVKIYTIGVGSPESRQADGTVDEDKAPEFDEVMLKKVAALTGGIYSHAGSLEALQAMYRQIDALEKTRAQSWMPPVLRELYPPFAVLSLSALILLILLPHSLLRRLP